MKLILENYNISEIHNISRTMTQWYQVSADNIPVMADNLEEDGFDNKYLLRLMRNSKTPIISDYWHNIIVNNIKKPYTFVDYDFLTQRNKRIRITLRKKDETTIRCWLTYQHSNSFNWILVNGPEFGDTLNYPTAPLEESIFQPAKIFNPIGLIDIYVYLFYLNMKENS